MKFVLRFNEPLAAGLAPLLFQFLTEAKRIKSCLIEVGEYPLTSEITMVLEQDLLCHDLFQNTYYCDLIADADEDGVNTGTYGVVRQIVGSLSVEVSKIEVFFNSKVVKTQQHCLCGPKSPLSLDTVSEQCRLMSDLHNPQYYTYREYANMKKMGHLAAWPPVFHETEDQQIYSFLVMEEIPGQDFYKAFQDWFMKLSIELKLKFCSNFLKAIQSVTQAGLIHRDIKPENIMVDRRLIVTIIDFQFAIQYDPSLKGVIDAQRCGTVSYLAPEVVFNDLTRPGVPFMQTPAIDVFAAGRVLMSVFNAADKNFSYENCPDYQTYLLVPAAVRLKQELSFLDLNLSELLQKKIVQTLAGMLAVSVEKRMTIEQAITAFEEIEQLHLATPVVQKESLSNSVQALDVECTPQSIPGSMDQRNGADDAPNIVNEPSSTSPKKLVVSHVTSTTGFFAKPLPKEDAANVADKPPIVLQGSSKWMKLTA